MGSFVFDEDTAIRRVANGVWSGTLSDRWNAGSVPNGGYLMAIAGRMLCASLACPDPLSLTGHYLRPAQPGGVTGQIELLRRGRRMSFAAVTLSQRGVGAIARFTGVFGDLEAQVGETRLEGMPPPLPPPTQCVPVEPVAIEVARRFERRVAPGCVDWLGQGPDARAELCAWVRFADGRDQDVHALALTADALPPPLLAVYGARGWVPTLELTVQVRARPSPGWLLCRTRTRYLTRGLLENDGEFWDAQGQLVALARQLARFAEPDRPVLGDGAEVQGDSATVNV